MNIMVKKVREQDDKCKHQYGDSQEDKERILLLESYLRI